MKPLSQLKQLYRLQSIKPLSKERPEPLKIPISEIELILYSSNLCLFSMRILRDEIKVKNREGTLNAVNKEILKLYSLLSKDDYYQYATHTKNDTKKFFKDIGLKPRHIDINKYR
jgi:hypothetical protein